MRLRPIADRASLSEMAQHTDTSRMSDAPDAPPTRMAASLYSGIFSPAEQATTHEQHSDAPLPEEAPEKSTAKWSAALRFAPRAALHPGTRPRPPRAPAARAAGPSRVALENAIEPTSHRAPPAVGEPVAATGHVHASEPGPTTTREPSFSPPPMRLPPEEEEHDRALMLAGLEERGELPERLLELDVEEDEDVNEFYARNAKAAKKRKYRRKHAGSAQAAKMPSLDGEYDPSVPTDYAQFKAVMKRRRRDRIDRARFEAERARVEWAASEDTEEEESPCRSRAEPPGPPPGPPPKRPPALVQGCMPATAPGPPPKPPAAPGAAVPSEELAAKRRAAAEIAARLSLGAPFQRQGPSVQPALERRSDTDDDEEHRPDPLGFAERLMAKYGHKKGEGLGAEGNKGIHEPLEVSKAHVQGGDAAIASHRGTIVNKNADASQEQAYERFGEPSEVVLLENVADPSELDNDLRQEIADGCNEHGFVQRVQMIPETPAGVRIFVRFSGMAGAYRAVRNLDGCYFGGRRVRARYYPLTALDEGNYLALL